MADESQSDPSESEAQAAIETAPSAISRLLEPVCLAGRYLVERPLARGGMATVYLAKDTQLERRVALKVLLPPTPEQEDVARLTARFNLEARTLAALSHPNIVNVYDYGVLEDDGFFLSMEYVEGKSFSQLIKGKILPQKRTLALMLQVCDALRYIHARGLVHRDIKLSNLMVQEDAFGRERVRVLDFGLVKDLEADRELTGMGVVMGSPHFMAPEQVVGGPVDARADQYSVGVLLYYALTGKPPYHGQNPVGTMTAHVLREVPSVIEARPNLEAGSRLDRVISRCLAKNVDDRYPNMDALMGELEAILRDEPEAPPLDSASAEPVLLTAPARRGEDDRPLPARKGDREGQPTEARAGSTGVRAVWNGERHVVLTDVPPSVVAAARAAELPPPPQPPTAPPQRTWTPVVLAVCVVLGGILTWLLVRTPSVDPKGLAGDAGVSASPGGGDPSGVESPGAPPADLSKVAEPGAAEIPTGAQKEPVPAVDGSRDGSEKNQGDADSPPKVAVPASVSASEKTTAAKRSSRSEPRASTKPTPTPRPTPAPSARVSSTPRPVASRSKDAARDSQEKAPATSPQKTTASSAKSAGGSRPEASSGTKPESGASVSSTRKAAPAATPAPSEAARNQPPTPRPEPAKAVEHPPREASPPAASPPPRADWGGSSDIRDPWER